MYNFQVKIEIFLFFLFLVAQNIDCGYTLEPPRWFVRVHGHTIYTEQKEKVNTYFIQ